MNKIQSLDDLISKKAAEYADQIRAAAAMADKEEEIRIESEKQLAFIQKDAGIKLEGKHEFTVASGRIDSVYSRVIIEYKNPKSPPDRIGPKADSPGSKKVIEQIKKRFYDMRSQHGQPLNSLFGVGLDGNYFIFIRFRDDKWQVQEPVEVNRNSAERFLWALFNLGTKGKPFSPEYLAGDFGSEGGETIAVKGIHALYEAIVVTDNPKAQTFYSQWKILFGEVCGYDVDNPSDRIKKLAEFYQVGVKGFKPAELLFAVHTYYALFMKLLAAEIVAFFHKLPTPLQKMMQAGTSTKLKREMEDLEAGSIFRHLNITNFLEGDLFAWYTSVWSEPIEKLVRDMVSRLDNYNPGTLSEDPSSSRDLLKKLYQQLFPKSVRHDLGEYYTPDWLAEHVLNELGYDGNPDKRLLDPSCGSGTFDIMAINRTRRWYEENRERCDFDEGGLCRKILSNIIGFDLNPLAVMAARTNYLIAIRDLIGHVDKIEIPIYLCDSILTPTEYGDLFTGKHGVTRELKTAAARFLIPVEITKNRNQVALYAEQLEFCVKNGYSPSDFISRCNEEGLPVKAEDIHVMLYNQLVQLDKANKNGVWARIIKNAFAPVFIGKVDYIAGNPPWVNIENLPIAYRQDIDPLWDKYELKHSLSGPQIGSTKRDICALFVFSCVDHFLNENCSLGFVLTQSLFKSKGGGDGFRRLSYTTESGRVYLQPKIIHDLSDFNVFQGATNRTSVLVVKKTPTAFKYPVNYALWRPRSTNELPEDWTLATVMNVVEVKLYKAIPSDPNRITSPWLTLPKDVLKGLSKVRGSNVYRAYTGAYTGGLNGAYWLREIEQRGKQIVYENMGDVGKIKVEIVNSPLESELVFPLLRGRDVHRWTSKPSAFILLPYDVENSCWISEHDLKRSAPHSYEFLLKFKDKLLRRKTAIVRQQMDRGPFYAMVAVGKYTFASWKVVYKRLSNAMQAAVVPGRHIPHEKLIMIPARSKKEANFIAALLNSSPANLLLRGAAVRVQTIEYTPSDIAQLAIPMFNQSNTLHEELAILSEECHACAKNEDHDAVVHIQKQIDLKAAHLWGLSDKELRMAQDALSEMEFRDDSTSDDE
ncbi:MAG TPA: N-6 DNA methylase [Nitrospirota bacterium]|nr:N-6 DNA methylase [Nitrospirota bacterium]